MSKQSTKAEDGPAPGKYRDLSLPELFDMFPDDRAAMGWLGGNIWPDGRRCPRCDYKYTCASRHPGMPYYCSECSKRFSVRIGTVMEQSKISYRNWAMATYLLATRPKGMSGVQLERDLGTGQGAAWFLLHRPREAWRTPAGPDPVAGPAGAGGAYLGGREKNRHADKKGRRRKTAVVGIRDGEAGTVRAMPVPETAAARLVEFVGSNADPDSEKLADENRAYDGLKNRHTASHGDGEYVRGGARTSGTGPFWALAGRGYNGTSRHTGPRHLHRHTSEFSGRLSDRAAGAVEKMGNIVRNLAGKRLTCKQLVAGKSLCGAP